MKKMIVYIHTIIFFIQFFIICLYKKIIYIHAEILQPLLLRVNMHALSFTISPTKLSPFAGRIQYTTKVISYH